MMRATDEVIQSRRRPGVRASFERAAAMALLPASILPVLLLGPGLLRAPEKLWRETRAEVQRLQERPDAPPRWELRKR